MRSREQEAEKAGCGAMTEARWCGYARPHEAHDYEATGSDGATDFQRWPFSCPGVDRDGVVGQSPATDRPASESGGRERGDVGRSATGSSADGPVPTAVRNGDQDRRLACPYCGSDIEADLQYRSGSYSEHRDLTGYECENYQCDARWDNRCNVERPSKLVTPPRPSSKRVIS